MAIHRSEFTVKAMSEAYNVSRSGFYGWLKNQSSEKSQKRWNLLKEIRKVFEDSDGTYGSPRVTKQLRRNGIHVNHKPVEKLMKLADLRAETQKKFRVPTTDSNHKLPVSANILDRKFNPEKPNQVWVSDITYIKTIKGFVFLCVIVDLFSRKIVSWDVREHMKTTLIADTLKKALTYRKITPWKLIFHSDRGSQYASREFRNMLSENKIISSMSRTGDCFDNACAESIFATIKKECVHRREFENLIDVQMELFRYIEGFYNRKRLHSYLGYMSPEDFENIRQAV